VVPYLVHRLIRWSGGLDVASDCTTRPFWVPIVERLCSLSRGGRPSYEALEIDALRSRSLFLNSRFYVRSVASQLKRSAWNFES
jgi:hypothetical protein